MSEEIHYDRDVQDREQKERNARTPHKPSELVPTAGSDSFDPLVSEMRKLLATNQDACAETKLLIQMAIDAQQGKPIDVSRMNLNSYSAKKNTVVTTQTP